MSTRNYLSKKKTQPIPSGKKKFRLFVIICILAAGFSAFFLIPSFIQEKPFAKIESCRKAINAARSAEAERYAPNLFAIANETWERMLMAWREENAKIVFSRDMRRIGTLADQTQSYAVQALHQATIRRDSLKTFVTAKIYILKIGVENCREQYTNIPMRLSLRKDFVAGEMLLSQSEALCKRNDFLTAAKKLALAEPSINRLGSEAREKLTDYLADVPKWQVWVSETIAWSRKNSTAAIIINKMAKTCCVYLIGTKKIEVEAEFGSNWMGHKFTRGDKATPEGRYRITRKKSGGQTIYYKALEINYPNQDDLKHFQDLKRAGRIERGASLGGLIEIHGGGQKGTNWTEGCIALSNDDMDSIFKLVAVGTPVTIVGTLHAP